MSNFPSLQDEEGRAVVLYTNTNNLTVALGHVAGKRKFQVDLMLFFYLYRKHTKQTQTITKTNTSNLSSALRQVQGKTKTFKLTPCCFPSCIENTQHQHKQEQMQAQTILPLLLGRR